MPPATLDEQITSFIARWAASGAAERANFPGFIYELCAILDVALPEPTVPDDALNAYVFERAVTFSNPDGTTSSGRIDLYRRGCFVMEAKQGSDAESADPFAVKQPRRRRGTARRGTVGWDDAMLAARGQAEQYVRALEAGEGNPPFVVVVDVGHSIELFADFTRSGKTYVPFPDARNHRIMLRDLARPDVARSVAARGEGHARGRRSPGPPGALARAERSRARGRRRVVQRRKVGQRRYSELTMTLIMVAAVPSSLS
jgi:hypothetical protein